MKNHTKIYFKHFGYDTTDYVPCETCGATAVDIHHIECRGMGGSNAKDTIENLMALCRACHIRYGDKKEYIEYLKLVHEANIS